MCELWQVSLRTCLEDGNVRYCVLQASFHVDSNNTLRSDASVTQRSRQRICGVIQLPVGHLSIICTDNCNLLMKIVADLLIRNSKGGRQSGGGATYYSGIIFSENCMKVKKIGSRGGVPSQNLSM